MVTASGGTGIYNWGGAKPKRRRHEDRGADGAESETLKALRGMGMGRGFPPPQPTRGSGGASGAPAKNDSGAF